MMSVGGKEVLIKGLPKRFPRIQCLGFLKVFAIKFIHYMQTSGGGVIKQRRGYIGLAGRDYVRQSIKGGRVLVIWYYSTRHYLPNKCGDWLRTRSR